MTAGIGHNRGPSMERGKTYRTYQWKRARQKLMPKTIPLMVVKMRVRRARELGMDYATYARCRQASGHDILALLFSSNALGLVGLRDTIPGGELTVLQQVKGARKLALVHRPKSPKAVLDANPVLHATDHAPRFTDSWNTISSHLQNFVQHQAVPARQVVVIGDTSLEQEWMVAARAGAYLTATDYFAQT